MSRDLGRDVPDLEKLYARKLWADFSYPTKGQQLKGKITLALFTLFGTFPHFLTLFPRFFRIFPPGLFLPIKGVLLLF